MKTETQKKNLEKVLYFVYGGVSLIYSTATIIRFLRLENVEDNPISEVILKLAIFLSIGSILAAFINKFTTKIPLSITYTILGLYLFTTIIFTYIAITYMQ